MSTRIEPLLTIQDLDAMPDDGNRYEIIEGELFVSCAPNLLHQRISGRLLFKIMAYLEDNRVGEVLPTPAVILSEISAVIPDLVFVSDQRLAEIASGDRITGAPDLVVEILSPGNENERRDRVAKRQLYAKYGVSEYWIVNPDTRTVEVYRLSEETLQLTAEYRKEDELVSEALPGFSTKVADLFTT